MCKMCWTIVVILAVITGGMAYKFILSGSVSPGSDGRLALKLSEGEKNLILSEMRTFLSSVQLITSGIGKNDMKQVIEAARKVGRATQNEVPGSLMGKLPLKFKKLGFDTHTRFDQLALDAEQMGDKEYTLNQLADLMQNCVACHAGYRIELVKK